MLVKRRNNSQRNFVAGDSLSDDFSRLTAAVVSKRDIDGMAMAEKNKKAISVTRRT